MLELSWQLERAQLALLAMQRHSWEQGVAMQAFLERGDVDVVVSMAKEAAYRATEDGRCAIIGVNDAITDPCSVGEALLFAAETTGDQALRIACDNLLRWALELAPRNPAGILYHLTGSQQFWVDSMYMLPPYLSAAGHAEEALHQWNGYWAALYDPRAADAPHVGRRGWPVCARSTLGRGQRLGAGVHSTPNRPHPRGAGCVGRKGRYANRRRARAHAAGRAVP